MGMLLLTGDRKNWMSRGTVTVSSADSVFGASNVANDLPSQMFRFAGVTADPTITLDTQLLVNGGVESGIATAWIDGDTGTGASIEEVTTIRTGTKSIKLSGGASGTARRYQDVGARAGETLRAEAGLRGDGTIPAKVRILNLSTGKYLTTGGVWQSAATHWATRTVAAFDLSALTFTVEDYWAVQAATCSLRYEAVSDGNGNVFVDDLALYAGAIDFLSIHGHNLTPGLAVEVYSSDDGSAWTLRGTATVAHPAFYLRLAAPVAARYWRIKFGGTPVAAPYFGEVVLGAAHESAFAPAYPITTRWTERQIGEESGDAVTHSQSEHATRVLQLEIPIQGEDAHDELLELLRRCRGTLYTAVVVPDDDEPEVVYGVLPRNVTVAQRFLESHEVALTVRELDLPVVIPA